MGAIRAAFATGYMESQGSPVKPAAEVIDAVETLVDTYLKVRASPGENFLAAYRRLGQAPFKEALYAPA